MKNLLTLLLCISILITTFVFAEEQQQELNIPVYVTIKGNNVTLQDQILSIIKKGSTPIKLIDLSGREGLFYL